MTRPADLAWQYAEAFNRHDVDALAALFAEDADYVNEVGLVWRNSRSIVRAHARAFASMYARARFTVENVLERPVADGVRVIIVRWRLEHQLDPEGAVTEPRRGHLSAVLERRDGGWLIVSAHNSDLTPGVDTLVAHDGALEPTSYIVES